MGVHLPYLAFVAQQSQNDAKFESQSLSLPICFPFQQSDPSSLVLFSVPDRIDHSYESPRQTYFFSRSFLFVLSSTTEGAPPFFAFVSRDSGPLQVDPDFARFNDAFGGIAPLTSFS